MASTIIGFTDKKLRFTKRLLFREQSGLERIQEDYVFKTSDFNFLSEKVFLNGKSQKDVSAYVEWTTGQSLAGNEKLEYDKMVIERIEYQAMQGGLTLAIITYVGLYSTQTPAPILSIEPIVDNNWLFHNFALKAQFVEYIDVPGSLVEINAISKKYKTGNIIKAINNVSIFSGIASGGLYITSDSTNLEWNLKWLTCPTRRSDCYQDPNTTVQTITPFYGNLNYYGFCLYSVIVQRYGLYGVFSIDIRDQAFYTINPVSFICIGGFTFPACASYLNIPVPGTSQFGE